MNLLLTNDDGIYAEGLWALYKRFAGKHSVVVIAPDRECSAVGHGITLNMPLRTRKIVTNGGYSGYAVSGTPVDCIKLALLELLPCKPDMVISGINPGANVGVNINYSGTVSAAKEAAMYGIPSIAVSILGYREEYYHDAARFIEMLVKKISEKRLTPGTLLNVNFPEKALCDVAGVRISRQSTTFFTEYIQKRVDPRNQTYYWHGSDGLLTHSDLDVDDAALARNFISITPIKCDMTDYNAIEDLKKWQFDPLEDTE